MDEAMHTLHAEPPQSMAYKYFSISWFSRPCFVRSLLAAAYGLAGTLHCHVAYGYRNCLSKELTFAALMWEESAL